MMQKKTLFVVPVAIWILLLLKSAHGAPPTWTDTIIFRYVCENLKANDYAYTIDNKANVEYSISNLQSVDFKMCSGNAAADGRVCATKDLDRESLGQYIVTEVATTTGTSESINRGVTVILRDANDNSPVFDNLPYTFELNEGTRAGYVVGVISATDNDDGWAASVTLSLTDDKNMLALSGSNTPATLSINETLDFEESPIYIGELTATDKGDIDVGCGPNIANSADTRIYLNVIDGPDTPPTFNLPQYSASVEENTAKLNLQVEARDGDFGLNWVVTYKFVDSSDIFAIDKDTGKISVNDASKIDRESESAKDGLYTLEVKAIENMPSDYNLTKFDGFPGPQNETVTVTIYVIDANDNDPQFYSDSTYKTEVRTFSKSVSESTKGTIPEFRIYVKDGDEPSNAQFNLTVTGADAEYFELSAEQITSEASLSVSIVKDLDYETKNMLTCEINAVEDKSSGTNATTATTTVTLTIMVTDENDNFPVFEKTNAEVKIPEGSPIGHIVTVIKASDADSGEYGEIKFSVQPQDSGFGINETTGEVFVTVGDLDREIRDTYYLTILASDKEGLVNTTQLIVTLTDVNDEQPTFLQSQYLVNWNENDESPDAISVSALDRDDPSTDNSYMEIFLDDPNIAAQFTIDQTAKDGEVEGSITPSNKLDAEVFEDAVCDNGVIEFNFKIYVRDGGDPLMNSSADVTIFFRDENDNTPYFNSSVYYGSVPEESEKDTDIVAVFANDDDKCLTNNDITFTVDNEFADNFLMGTSIDGSSTLMVRRSLDRNDQEYYDVIVYAVDSGQPRNTANATVKVTITDINNKDPNFNITNVDNVHVSESDSNNTEIASVFAYDDDLNPSLVFSITKYRCIDENDRDVAESLCSDWFRIETKAEEGVIIVANELDRETVETVVLTIQVQDLNAAGNEQISETTLTIQIDDRNDNPPIISKPSGPFPVIEESSNGTVLGTLTASDADVNNNITFSVKSKYITISSDGIITVQGDIDRETDPGDAFSAVIVATDDVKPRLMSNITIYFNVIDANDNNPIFTRTNYECSIKEAEPKGTFVCQIVATDEDIGNNGKIVYSLPSVTQFNINSTTGDISSNEPFNREFRESYQFKLRASDSAGNLARETEVDLTITIEDIDDNNPTYEGYGTQEIAITEEKLPNSLMGKVQKAFDEDTEENQQNYYYLVYEEGNDLSDKFLLNSTSRELVSLQTLDREKNSSYIIHVLTTKNDTFSDKNLDDYDPNMILTVTVVVTDLNDNAPKFERDSDTTDLLYSTAYGENNIVVIVVATDPDAEENSTLLYEIVSQEYYPPNGVGQDVMNDPYFEIDSGNGQVKTTAKSFEGSVEVLGRFQMTITVTDGGGLTDTMTLDVKIFDETETVILESRYSEDYLEENRNQLEKDLEETLNADVVIDKIVPVGTANNVDSRAAEDQSQTTITEIHFHATEWNETTLIPSEEIAAELDSSANDEILITWAVVSIGTSEPDSSEAVSPTDLLKVILAVVSSVLILFLVVLAIAFVCMRTSYKRKIKVALATQDASKSMEDQRARGDLHIPGTNRNATGESTLYVEDQKGNINLEEWQKFQESNDDNNSIDDNAVDSQDSAISGDRPGSFRDDDLDNVDIDYSPNNDLANLQSALNRRGAPNMVFDNDYATVDDTVM